MTAVKREERRPGPGLAAKALAEILRRPKKD